MQRRLRRHETRVYSYFLRVFVRADFARRSPGGCQLFADRRESAQHLRFDFGRSRPRITGFTLGLALAVPSYSPTGIASTTCFNRLRPSS